MIAGCLVAIGALASILARLLHQSGTPGGWPSCAILGGLIAGVLLGATTFGRVAPHVYIRVFEGGAAEQAEVDEMVRRHTVELVALQRIDATPIAIDEQRTAQARELAPLLEALDAARSEQRGRWVVLWGLLAASWLLFGAVGAARLSRGQDPIAPGVISGISGALFAAAPAFLLIRWTTHVPVETAVVFAGAIGAGGAHFDARTRCSGWGGRRRGVDLAALAALLIATVVIAGVVRTTPALNLAFVSLLITALRFLSWQSRMMRRRLRIAATGVMLPMVVAGVVAHIDLLVEITSRDFWIAFLIAAILCADARWVGGWIGWRAVGRDRQWQNAWMRSAAALTAGVSGIQIVIAGGAMISDVMSSALAAGVILSAPMIELAVAMRQRLSRSLDAGLAASGRTDAK